MQDNESESKYTVQIGLHHQVVRLQGGLEYASEVEVWDVIVDFFQNTPFFGK